MRIKLDPRKRPVRCKLRRYPAPQRAFLNKYVDKLVEMGFFIPNPNAQWQAAPLLVPKNSKACFRTTIDLRPVNAATIKQAWPMPNLDAELQDFAGSTCFASLDFCSGYWQLPMHQDSYNACGVICPNGTYSSTRVLQGLTNAVSYFQSTVEPLFAELRGNMKAWLDDFNLHGKTEVELLSRLCRFFEICQKYNLFLSAKKSNFFAREIKWCGRIISKDGYKIDPSNAAALRNMQKPTTADELCEFIHCCRWMALAIPDFCTRVAPLTKVLEEAYRKSGRRTKSSIKKISIRQLSWGTEQDDALSYLQETLRNAIKLAHPKPGYSICIHTDASERFWAGVVSQVRPNELSKPVLDQKHEPLGFLGGEFTGSERNWTTYEKEGFAIYRVFEKLDYMLMGEQPVHVFTDHRNLLFVFSPTALQPTIGRHVISKVQRWAMFLSRFDFSIEHIDGCKNIFADILTRWVRGYRSEGICTPRIQAVQISDAQVVPSSSEIEWPSWSTIRESQLKNQDDQTEAVPDSCNVRRIRGKIWIPERDLELQLKILVISHCGSLGHRGASATESVILEDFHWKGLKGDVQKFVASCIHCIVSRSGKLVPRPLASALHATSPNEILHVDYLYMGSSTERDLQYVLVMRDDLSSFVWLWPTPSATGEAAADALSTWIATFGSIQWLVTDQGPHFTSSLISNLTRDLHVSHHFTTAYSPWANGSVERICKEVLRSCQALLHEFRLAPSDWPSVTECIQSILNHSPVKRLGMRQGAGAGVYRTPLEVFTSHKPSRPLLRALPFHQYPTVPSLEEARARQLLNIEELQGSLESMHRDVGERVTSERSRVIAKHNLKTNIQPINFTIGDFVLVRRAQDKGHKLSFKWLGPRRIKECKSPLVFVVENLLTGKQETVHARRLLLYRSNMDGVEVEPALLKVSEHSETQYQTVRSLLDIRGAGRRAEILIEWDGLPDKLDRTWEPAEQVQEDVPDLLETFLRSSGKRDLKQRTLAAVFN